MIDKILASSFLDFTATYRLHLWTGKKTERFYVPVMVKLSHSVQVRHTSSARRAEPTGSVPFTDVLPSDWITHRKETLSTLIFSSMFDIHLAFNI